MSLGAEGQSGTLTVTNGLPCNEIFAHTFDKQDSLWLYTACGLIQITDKELERWWQQPNVKLRFRLFDSYDGAHPGRSYFNGATRTPNGRLWFVNNVDAQMIDPAHIPSNRLAPPVRIEGLIADRRNYSTFASVHLPPLTRDLEIRYAGLSFAVPEKVRFRYKLEHHDVDWQDPELAVKRSIPILSPESMPSVLSPATMTGYGMKKAQRSTSALRQPGTRRIGFAFLM